MKGGCHCGAIQFEIAGEASWVGACYCVDCRNISGSPYTVFAGFAKDDVKIVSGSPAEYASSENVRRSFCMTCSAPFSYTYVGSDANGVVFIPVGVLDDPSAYAPKEHIWVSQKLPWVHIHDDFPQKP